MVKSFMMHKGFLDDRFLVLEDLEEHQPDFVESIMSKYIPSAADYIQKLQGILDNNLLNLAEFERLMLKLKGASASVGTAKLTAAVDEMLADFHRHNTDINRLGAALGKVRSEHFAMKSRLEPYIEILAQLRGEGPPVDGSDSNEDD
ncbi:pseudo histidine-containing phosphotransfer protein 2-like isoform X2 [Silene latifolia]|uniref:pseudo histidine-containing phosphotransfer protein 2-like isoform X2 n=1 Tax=Silene latifolia TaxID=37657 RepID=UPI003D775236